MRILEGESEVSMDMFDWRLSSAGSALGVNARRIEESIVKVEVIMRGFILCVNEFGCW